jgi:hypothetical protein
MHIHETRIVLPHSGKATLFVFGDMQFGTKEFDEDMWAEFENDFRSTKHAYAIGLGDYDDFVRWTVRKPLIEAMHGDDSVRARFDSMVMKGVDTLYEKMKFMKGRIIGMHGGHHEWDFQSGVSSTQMLCQRLGSPYLAWTAYTLLKFETMNKKSGTSALKIWSTHGAGGSMFSSGDLANLERKIAPYWIADLYLRGHSSKLEMTPIELNDITVRSNGVPRLIKKTRWLVNVGGFMKGYGDGEASYVERCNMPPACLGWAKVGIEFSTLAVKCIDGKATTGLRIQPVLCSPSDI